MVNFPASLDALTNPTAADRLDGTGENSLVHSEEHGKLNDIVEALEAKVGVDNSDVAASLDYKISHRLTVFDVTHYGAEIDGATDDSAAIQDAIDACEAAGGGVIYIPAGTSVVEAALTLPEKCKLLGAGRGATLLDINHTGNGIELTGEHASVESLGVRLGNTGTVGNAIVIHSNKCHIRDVVGSGGTTSSWIIDVDYSNIVQIENVDIGGDGVEELSGNGIIFRNTDKVGSPFNFGDALISKVDVQLSENNTTGIKFEGPEYDNWANSTLYTVGVFAFDTGNSTLYKCAVQHTSAANPTSFSTDRSNNPTYWTASGANKINNVLLSQVEITGGSGGLSGDIGVHIYNSARITLCHVDLENLSIGVSEAGSQNNGAVAEHNCYIQTIALNCDSAYTATGTVARRTIIGGDNFPGTGFLSGYTDTDSIFPRDIWLTDASGGINVRLQNSSGNLRMNDGNDDGSLQFTLTGSNPTIAPVETGGGARMFLGNTAIRCVDIFPAAQFYENPATILSTTDGSLAFQDGSTINHTGFGKDFIGRTGGQWLNLANGPGGAATVNLKTTGATTLFTVPTGRVFIPTHAFVYAATIDTLTGDASISMGPSGDLTDIVDTVALASLNATGDVQYLTLINAVGYAAGVVIQVNVSTGATATTMSGRVAIIGVLI